MRTDVLCWDPIKVREVINPEAEAVPDAVFRAVHSPWMLRASEPIGTAFQQLAPSSYRDIDPFEFVAQFTQEGRPHVQVAIIGRSGSGKSHLIHWLRLQLPSSDQRLVLLIPKVGTSLRSILGMIIAHLPEEERTPFYEQLNKVGEATATREGQRERLLFEIAQAIREEQPTPGPDQEVEEELIRTLPDLFQDPHMKSRHFLTDRSVVSSIVDHVFSAPNSYRPTDDRRAFRVDDLPTDGNDIKNASKQARAAIEAIYLNEALYKPMAVGLVNRVLNTAISRALSFSGDRLIHLMTTLRQYLKWQGKELVLLIEDFARLQGIDRALLQALLVQGDEVTCKVRWAIAVTTGFFESVAETVYTRMTFLVDMDQSAGHADAVDRISSLAQFTARYLNAVRIGRRGLEKWSNSATVGSTVPNACDPCPRRESCHEAFGAEEGVGLFPFTRQALHTMTGRVEDTSTTIFNPRTLQTSILAKVLDNFAPDLREQRFPPLALLKGLGGMRKLTLAKKVQLQQLIPSADVVDRLTTALELWDGTGSLQNLPVGIRTFFGLPEIPTGLEEVTPRPLPGPQPPVPDHIPQPSDPTEDRLLGWATRGEPLEQGLAQRIRTALFDAISDSIDWDAVGLVRGAYISATGTRPFRRNSIHLSNAGAPIPSAVELQIPPPNCSRETHALIALALLGLLKYQEHDDWTFKGGAEALPVFLEFLDVWCRDVVLQLQTIAGGVAAWNPPTAAVELLLVGAALGGKIKPDDSAEELLVSVLAPLPEEAFFGGTAAGLFRKIGGRQEKFLTLIRSVTSATKGGTQGAMIDPRSILKAIRQVKANQWRLAQTPLLEGRTQDLKDLAQIYADVSASLPAAVKAEHSARLEWFQNCTSAFGADPKRKSIVETLEAAVGVARSEGVSGNRERSLTQALEEFSKVQFDDTFAAARSLKPEDDPLAMLPHLRRVRIPAMDAASRLIEVTKAYLAELDTQLARARAEYVNETAELEDDRARIQSSFDAIASAFSTEEPANAP